MSINSLLDNIIYNPSSLSIRFETKKESIKPQHPFLMDVGEYV